MRLVAAIGVLFVVLASALVVEALTNSDAAALIAIGALAVLLVFRLLMW